MLSSGYDYLTGVPRVGADAPADWQALDTLPFWERPNDGPWSGELSRVLYHESIHFWQFLASAYVANLVAQEWGRVVQYEQTGQVAPPSPAVTAHGAVRPGDPFAPAEMVEAWARFWDVHTRSPAQIIAEERIAADDPDAPAAPVRRPVRVHPGGVRHGHAGRRGLRGSREDQVVPWKEVDEEQILNSLDRLSPQGRRKVLVRLIAGADVLERTTAALQPRISELARRRGLDWTRLSDEERERLVDDVLHE